IEKSDINPFSLLISSRCAKGTSMSTMGNVLLGYLIALLVAPALIPLCGHFFPAHSDIIGKWGLRTLAANWIIVCFWATAEHFGSYLAPIIGIGSIVFIGTLILLIFHIAESSTSEAKFIGTLALIAISLVIILSVLISYLHCSC